MKTSPDGRWRRLGRNPRLKAAMILLLLGLVIGVTLNWLRGPAHPEIPSSSWISLSSEQGFLDAWIPTRAAALAPGPGGKADVYLGWARFTPEGELISVWRVSNATRSPSTHERELQVAPGRFVYSSALTEDGATSMVEVVLVDEDGRGENESRSWSQRAAAALTDFELWGQPCAPRRIRLSFHRPARDVRLELLEDDLLVHGRGERLELDLDTAALREGEARASVSVPPQGDPDLFRWAVDQLRYSDVVGPERLQWLEHVYLEVSDAYMGIAGEHVAANEEIRVARQLGRLTVNEPGESNWPPPPLEPFLDPPLDAEGLWRERDHRFITHPEGVPPLFYSTFVRTDRERPNTSRVYLTVWNPAWLELDWIAGTMEPRSTHGIAGSGRVPTA